MKNRLKIVTALLIILAFLSSCERTKIRKTVETEKNTKVVWMREDSCFSVTRPLMSARFKASKATRTACEQAHQELMRMGDQMNDRGNDHGGLKVKCYWVGYTYDGQKVDSTVVMIEPSGEIITDLDEHSSWFDASEEIGKICNIVYSR